MPASQADTADSSPWESDHRLHLSANIKQGRFLGGSTLRGEGGARLAADACAASSGKGSAARGAARGRRGLRALGLELGHCVGGGVGGRGRAGRVQTRWAVASEGWWGKVVKGDVSIEMYWSGSEWSKQTNPQGNGDV